MKTYTAYNDQDSSNYISGLSLQEALDERWDIDGSAKASGWSVMTDADFTTMQKIGDEQHLECMIGADGVMRITRVVG